MRSATEVEAIREEKLLLGQVIERFENEALKPIIDRVLSTSERSGLLPEPPESLGEGGQDLEVQFVSTLAIAQRAAGTVPMERAMQFIGELSGVIPEAQVSINWPEFMYRYLRDIGVPLEAVNSVDDMEDAIEEMKASQEAQEATATAGQAAQGAQVLSQTDVGGGLNALEAITSG